MQKDRSRIAVEKAAQTAFHAIERFQASLPLGPNQIQMTRGEIQNELRKAEGKKLLAFMDMLGTSEFAELVSRINGNKNTKSP